jgi:hypothetical protein
MASALRVMERLLARDEDVPDLSAMAPRWHAKEQGVTVRQSML